MRSFNILVILLLNLCVHAQEVSPTLQLLQCEHLTNPLGMDDLHPRLSWQMADGHQGAAQKAYRLTVGTDSLALTTGSRLSWDSGKQASDTTLVTYRGPLLKPFSRYYWRVEAWNEQGKQLVSPVQFFETGMLSLQNWAGSWISDGHDIDLKPAPYFRKVFSASKKVKSARAYIAVGGLYELYINGNKVGNHRLDPAYTRFDRRNIYVTYDVTAQLKEGNNAIGVLLGNGWYNHQSGAVWDFDKAPWRNRPAFCLDLRITYTDGTSEVVSSGLDWKTSSGPLVFNSIYSGERYDARLEQAGWNTINFDDKHWKNVSYRAAPSTHIVAQAMPPIRNVERIAAKSVKKINDTTYVFDLGRNIAGVSELTVAGESGTVITLKHGERLAADGHVDLSNIDVYHRPHDPWDKFGTDVVILSGKGKESFMPKFNYKGFQYVEVTSSQPLQLGQDDLCGYFMHSDVSPVGHISSSSQLVDKLWWASNNSYLSNLFGYPTDCPQREKNGWTGDGHFAIETGLNNFDAITVYEKWMADHWDEQQPNGVLPDIVPTSGWGYGTANGTDWTSTIAIIPWTLYVYYGDSRILERGYEHIKRYVDYIDRISKDGLTSFGRGDWVPVKSNSSLELTSSVYFYVDATILAKAAKLLGRIDDQQHYEALAARIKKAINDKYLDAAKGIYASGTQTELSVPLYWGLVPEELKDKVAQNLASKVMETNFHLDVGVLGAKAILNALSENGQGETAYKLAAQDSYPSWGWWIVNGATTLYENWNIQATRDISLNHMMFGEIGGWFFKGPGGIRADEHHPGFKHILLQPLVPAGLNHFEASHEGPYGTIRSAWKKVGKKITFDVVVPPNSSATFIAPSEKGKSLYEKGKKRPVGPQELTSGRYSFELK
ncbi:alpha-L-rhamnosidase [bacterium A37T11]|nr:alpha-L-rhamnosidase [bacterium A37T11]